MKQTVLIGSPSRTLLIFFLLLNYFISAFPADAVKNKEPAVKQSVSTSRQQEATCDVPGISSSFCEATKEALKNGSCEKFNFDEENLCKQFKAAFHINSCEGIVDHFGHCQAMLNFKSDSCENFSGEGSEKEHEYIICNALKFGLLHGQCASLEVKETKHANINQAEVAGICAGYQSFWGHESSTDVSLLEDLRLKIKSVSETLFKKFKILNGYFTFEKISEFWHNLGLKLNNERPSVAELLTKTSSFSLKPEYHRFDKKNRVPYLSERERQPFEARIDGKIFVAGSFNKRNPLLATGFFIYILGNDGKFYLIPHVLEGDPYYHSSIYGEAAIKAAGELIVKEGKIEGINYRSGHYKPDKNSVLLLVSHLILKGYQFKDWDIFIASYAFWD